MWYALNAADGDTKKTKEDTLAVKYKGKNINDVLEMSISEAYAFFENIPSVAQKLRAMVEVGLGYVRLGQSAVTLSGGESQRMKLAAELGRKSTGNTLYILDEPTTGLHSEDIKVLLGVLQRGPSAARGQGEYRHHHRAQHRCPQKCGLSV